MGCKLAQSRYVCYHGVVSDTGHSEAGAAGREGAQMGTSTIQRIASSAEISSTRQAYYSAAIGAEMIVSSCGWSKLCAETFGDEAIFAGEIICDRHWTATQDGRGMTAGWHEGATCGEEIYFERWSAERGYSHGWIDAKSRQITQTG